MLTESAEKTTRRVARNSIAQVVRFAAITISKLLIVIVIARTRGVHEVGDFSFVMTFTLTLGFLNNFGLTVLLMREVARDRHRIYEYTENTLTLSLGMGLMSIVVMGVSASLLGYSQVIVTAVYLTAIAMMLDTLGNLYVAAFAGYERMELGALAIVIQEVAFLVIGAVVLALKLDFLWLFVIYILSRFISLIASARIYQRNWGKAPRLGFDWALIKTLARKTLPFAVTSALSPVFARIDMLMLSYIRGNVEVGYYEVASTLFYRFNVLARFYNLAVMPLIANQFPVIGDKVVTYVRQANKYQALVGLPITALSLVLGGPFILAIYGAEFGPTVIAFQIMATAIFLRLVDNTLGFTLTAIKMESWRSVATAVGAVLNVALNLYAIPRYGFIGAAATSVITEIGFFMLLYIFVRLRLPNPFTLEMILRPALASLIMVVPLLLLRQWSVWILLPLGVILYGLLVLPLRVITPEELGFMLRVSKVEHFVPPRLRQLLSPKTTPME